LLPTFVLVCRPVSFVIAAKSRCCPPPSLVVVRHPVSSSFGHRPPPPPSFLNTACARFSHPSSSSSAANHFCHSRQNMLGEQSRGGSDDDGWVRYFNEKNLLTQSPAAHCGHLQPSAARFFFCLDGKYRKNTADPVLEVDGWLVVGSWQWLLTLSLANAHCGRSSWFAARCGCSSSSATLWALAVIHHPLLLLSFNDRKTSGVRKKGKASIWVGKTLLYLFSLC